MPLILRKRASHLSEKMDQPDSDPVKMNNTYRQFSQINPLISRWHKIYKRYILPQLEHDKTNTLLDIGFGGGDIVFKIAQWARQDGFKLYIKAIDTDERAMNYVQALPGDPHIEFTLSTLESIRQAGDRYDFVISNHLLHHLSTDELTSMLSDLDVVAKKRIIFNDIERSDIAFLFFSFFIGPFFRKSFAMGDGLRSIRRSFTKEELEETVPRNWQVIRIFPYRLILISDR